MKESIINWIIDGWINDCLVTYIEGDIFNKVDYITISKYKIMLWVILEY